MSSLLERIARRRRATANSRLGPRSQQTNGWEPLPTANGAAWEPIDRHQPVVRDKPPIEPELEAPAQLEPDPVAPAEPEPAPVTQLEPEPEPEPAPEPEPEPEAFVEHEEPPVTDWVEDEDVWIEPVPEHAPEPEPELAPEPEPQRPPQAPPAAAHPTPGEPPRSPTHLGLAERGQMRRRARYLRRLREVQLRDLGGFVLELNRFGRERPELVAAKLRAAAATDEELRALEIALDGRASMRELREAGIGGACTECGAVFGSADRFCASCGEPLGSELHHHREPHDERPR
jgi:hypothetical protein